MASDKADTFVLMNKCLAEYYKSLGNDTYFKDDDRGKFLAFCDENGYEETGMNEELFDEEPENCAYTEMDDKFPFPTNVENSLENMVKELRFCYKNGFPSTNAFNEEQKDNDKVHFEKYKYREQDKRFNQFEFKVNKDTILRTKKAYHGQEIIKLAKKNAVDETVLYWLAIGVQNDDQTFLLNLAMAYTRDRVRYEIRKRSILTVLKWIERKSALRKKLNQNQKRDLSSAIEAYTGRICQQFVPNEMHRIQDSMRNIALYIAMASHFVHMIIRRSSAANDPVLPCQIDFMIAVNSVDDMPQSPRCLQEEDSDGSDDDDNKEEKKTDYCDIFNDIVNKIKSNGCTIKESNIPFDQTQTVIDIMKNVQKNASAEEINMCVTSWMKRTMNEKLYVDFRKEMAKKSKKETSYPKGQRLCVFINRCDKEKNAKKEMSQADEPVFIYEPTDDCDTLPDVGKLVAEDYFNLSAKCLIPSEKKGDIKNIIRVTTPCNAQLITLSFHVEQADEIRCYWFWNGRCLRFYPKDIFNILPCVFDMKFGDNEKFIKSEEAIRIAKTIHITDVKFEKFYMSLDTNSTPLNKFSVPSKRKPN